MADGGKFTLCQPCGDGSSDELTVEAAEGLATVTIASPATGITTLEFDAANPDGPNGRGFAVSEVLVELIRAEGGLSHPSLLTVIAPPPLRDRIGVLGLADRFAVGEDHVVVPEDDTEGALWVSGYAMLHAAVHDHLRDRFGPEVEPWADGVFRVRIGPVGLRVKVAKDQPAIHLVAPSVFGVHSREQTDTELNVANRNSCWVRWSRRQKVVWQELSLPARPFVPSQFDAMLDLFVEACVTTRPDLADRLSGQVAR
ncbi:T3SS (YopN, CesT) and YbjN peptide-binding chaperone 1 [Propionibacteriaceae bacterium Y2011]